MSDAPQIKGNRFEPHTGPAIRIGRPWWMFWRKSPKATVTDCTFEGVDATPPAPQPTTADILCQSRAMYEAAMAMRREAGLPLTPPPAAT